VHIVTGQWGARTRGRMEKKHGLDIAQSENEATYRFSGHTSTHNGVISCITERREGSECRSTSAMKHREASCDDIYLEHIVSDMQTLVLCH